MNIHNFNLDRLVDLVGIYGLEFLGAVAIFIIGRWSVRFAVNVTKRLMTASKIDETLVSFVGSLLYGLGLTFVVIAALGQLGIQTTSLAAIIGAAGLAIGLSLQGSLGNLASGVLLIALHPFKVGDHIETSGKDGKVLEINIFTTTLKTAEGQSVIIPNAKITGDIIVNRSA